MGLLPMVMSSTPPNLPHTHGLQVIACIHSGWSLSGLRFPVVSIRLVCFAHLGSWNTCTLTYTLMSQEAQLQPRTLADESIHCYIHIQGLWINNKINSALAVIWLKELRWTNNKNFFFFLPWNLFICKVNSLRSHGPAHSNIRPDNQA